MNRRDLLIGSLPASSSSYCAV